MSLKNAIGKANVGEIKEIHTSKRPKNMDTGMIGNTIKFAGMAKTENEPLK